MFIASPRAVAQEFPAKKLHERTPEPSRRASRSVAMRLLILGAGGVGSAAVLIAARRRFPNHVLLADHDLARTQRAVAGTADDRFGAAQVRPAIRTRSRR